MSFGDELKSQANEMLFNASKGVGAQLESLGANVGALFQNGLDKVTTDDIEAAKAQVEKTLGNALETFSDILSAAKDLKDGKLPS